MEYRVALVKDRTSHNNVAAVRLAHGDLRERIEAKGGSMYGAFVPLFGLASNELYIVTSHATDSSRASVGEDSSLDVVESDTFVPTARPTDHTPRTKAGIYVFRWFSIYTKDIDEIVRLSSEAWVSFEGGFDTEVQCLFREPVARGDTGKMLLITWYTDLSVWEASRMPAPEARANFLKRASLTIEAKPICTRLALP